jgi:hypothetical protein
LPDHLLWSKEVLPRLQQQMTRATFETWLAQTHQLGEIEAETLTVGVANSFAQDWLENRLYETISRTVANLMGRPLHLKFVVNGPRPAQMEAAEATPLPEPGPGQIAVELISFDPTQRGFVMASNYATRFWQPYLDRFAAKASPFGLWVTLKSFAYECQKETWPSIESLADMCAKGQRYKILGRAERKGGGRIVGALEVLEAQRIVYVKKQGQASKISYRFRVLENLPLLTPRQAETLTPRLQKAHKRFLEQARLDYEEWAQMTLPTLTGDG